MKRMTDLYTLAEAQNRDPEISTAVSLHSHTLHSREGLMFIPQIASRIPLLTAFLGRQISRVETSSGRRIDFARMHWTPPAMPRTVLDQEAQQIRDRLDLEPLVSITDHDCIDGVLHLNVLDLPLEVPVSFEWSVPFEEHEFHLGVHNLPPDQARALLHEMLQYADQPDPARLHEVLATLDSFASTLLVLNHPCWNLRYDRPEGHKQALASFLKTHGSRIHALEVNGYRPWSENREVLQLSETTGKLVISGGDRHGWQPNTMLNLTAARSFADFVCEIREGNLSQVLILPEYHESRTLRAFTTADEVLRHYPRQPWRHQRWTDRVMVDVGDDGLQPLSQYWYGEGPWWLRSVLWLLRVAAHPRIRPALRFAIADEVIQQ